MNVRIGFDAKRATHNFRGLGNYSRGILEGLYQFAPEHELFLYTPPFKNERIVNWISHHPKMIVKLPQNSILKKVPAIWRSLLLEKDLIDSKIDIFHGLSHELPRQSKNKNYKSVVTMHDLIFMRYPEFFPLIDRVIYLKKFKYATQSSDLIIAICEQTKRDLIDFLGVEEKKIKVHYQSASPLFNQTHTEIEKQELKKKYNLSRNYILNVSAFEKNKNQLTLLDAFNLIYHKYDIDLVLIGNGKEYLKKIREKVKSYNLQNRVHIFNQVPFHELPIFYQSATLFCFPSFFEGFGIPIIEALFSKIPVVTSHGSSFPESAGPGALYSDPNSFEDFADKIEQVLKNENLKKQLIENGSIHSEQFTLENSTSSLLKIYQFLK